MDGRQKPNAQPENGNDLNDEEIIDLTQVVQEGNDDEIIDLTNVLDQLEKEPTPLNEAAERLQSMDEDIIDLNNVETTLEADIADTTLEDEEDDEDIIDLLDAVEPESLAAETDDLADLDIRAETTVTDTFDSTEELDIGIAREAPPTAEEDQDPTPPETMVDDDLIIDLTGMEAALDADIADTTLEDEEDDEDIIDLLDAVESESLATETDDLADLETRAETMLAETLDSTQEPDIGITEETSPAFEEDRDFMILEAQAGTSDEEFAPTALFKPSTTDTVPFNEQQLEAALERTIHRIYAEKIEHLMIQTIEKTVQREIEKIKRALLDDDELSD